MKLSIMSIQQLIKGCPLLAFAIMIGFPADLNFSNDFRPQFVQNLCNVLLLRVAEFQLFDQFWMLKRIVQNDRRRHLTIFDFCSDVESLPLLPHQAKSSLPAEMLSLTDRRTEFPIGRILLCVQYPHRAFV